MPCSPAKARLLLKEKKAIVVRRTPFTIQLTIATGEAKQPVSLGVDAGYKHVGLSASTEKAELYASEVELRQDVSDLLSARRALRQSRRSRNTRYRAPRFDNPNAKAGLHRRLKPNQRALVTHRNCSSTAAGHEDHRGNGVFRHSAAEESGHCGERVPRGRTARLLERPRVCSFQRRTRLSALSRQVERSGAQCSSLGKQTYRRRFARQPDYAL